MSSSSLRATKRKIAELNCTIVDTFEEGTAIESVAIICHGFGASGEDLVPCAAELFAETPGKAIRFVFPAAPIELEPGGYYDSRAWWPIDMVQLQEMIMSGEIRDLRKDKPELLEERSDELIDVIRTIENESQINSDQLILGGFSQGSMLATHVALSLDATPGGLIVWSGTLLNEMEWREKAPGKKGLKVVQSHGQIDPILPFVGAEWLRDFFTEFELDNDFYPFVGEHTISREALEKAGKLIVSVC